MLADLFGARLGTMVEKQAVYKSPLMAIQFAGISRRVYKPVFGFGQGVERLTQQATVDGVSF